MSAARLPRGYQPLRRVAARVGGWPAGFANYLWIAGFAGIAIAVTAPARAPGATGRPR
ncbi:MAG: hypothetical protein ACQSGP_29575 [Frankia sp.]